MNNPPSSSPAGALATARIIWAAMLMGEVIFFVVIVLVIWPQQRGQPSGLLGSNSNLLLYVACALLVMAAPAAFFIRAMIFRLRDSQGMIRPSAYLTGTVAFVALLEGAALFGLVNLMFARELWPHVLVPAVAMLLQLLGFPLGTDLGENA